MKKFIKAIILLPLWPFIWMAKGTYDSTCGDNARSMLRWYRK